MYTVKNYLQDVDYHLDEYVFQTVPGLILQDAYLAVRIDRVESVGGEWYIEAVYMMDAANNIVSFNHDHWLCSTLAKDIDRDVALCRLITLECRLDD